MCKAASNNTYIGALLQWLGLATNSKKITIYSKRVRVYSLCQADLIITRDELSRRAARMIRDGLELIPSHAFVDKLIDLSTPFIKDNTKRCGHPQNEIAQSSQNEVINIEPIIDSPNIEAEIAPGLIAQPTFITQIIESVESAVNFVADTVVTAIADYLSPEEIAAGFF